MLFVRVSHQRLRRARPVMALAAVRSLSGRSSARTRAAPRPSRWPGSSSPTGRSADYGAMYGDRRAPRRSRATHGNYVREPPIGEALATATATRVLLAGHAYSLGGGRVAVPVRVHTRLWGTLSLTFTVPTTGGGESPRSSWSRSLSFPGVPGRDADAPHDAAATRDAAGPRRLGARRKPARRPGAVAPRRSGRWPERWSETVGEAPAARRAALEAEGVPPGARSARAGSSWPSTTGCAARRAASCWRADGARRRRAAGRAAAAHHDLAGSADQRGERPRRPARRDRRARPSTGQVLAVAGIGLDGLQPPGRRSRW